jgi:hypothetical protein
MSERSETVERTWPPVKSWGEPTLRPVAEIVLGVRVDRESVPVPGGGPMRASPKKTPCEERCIASSLWNLCRCVEYSWDVVMGAGWLGVAGGSGLEKKRGGSRTGETNRWQANR